MNIPLRKSDFESVDPFGHAGFAGVDFLAAAHKADDGTPIRMAIHYGDEKFWLGHIEVVLSSFALHEASRLLTRPGTLSFIKHNNFLKRDREVADVLISEVMDVLDKTAYLALRCLFRDVFACGLVTCKGFSKDVNKWPVARQENGVLVEMLNRAPRCNVQPGECLSRAGYASHKANRFRAVLPRLVDHGANAGASFLEVLCTTIRSGDIGYAMCAI